MTFTPEIERKIRDCILASLGGLVCATLAALAIEFIQTNTSGLFHDLIYLTNYHVNLLSDEWVIQKICWLSLLFCGLIVALATSIEIYRLSNVGSRWRLFIFLPALLVLIGFYAKFTTTTSTIGYTLAIVLLAINITSLAWPPTKEEEDLKDPIARIFFAKRIAKHLIAAQPPIQRIAIIGPWGLGKSYLLKLIQKELKDKSVENTTKTRIVTAWANPWKASTKEEAWKTLASEFDNALRVSWLWGEKWNETWWFKAFQILMPKDTIGDKFLKAAASNSPFKADKYLKQIDSILSQRNLRLVMFVDDMERADPAAVRGLLPVIDKVCELENCFFIFAIDRDRLDISFQNGASGGDANDLRAMTTGFLDKVMDLQLDLPHCTTLEIAALADQQLEEWKQRCPKLIHAFPTLRDHLPSNPRICTKFLKSAERAEVLFLCDYKDDEKDYIALFFTIMAEAELPGFSAAFPMDSERLESLAVEAFYLPADADKEKGRNEVAAIIRKELTIKEGTYQSDRLNLLLDKIINRFINFTTNDFKWILGDYTKRLHLTTTQIETFLDTWRSNEASIPLKKILNNAIQSDGPSHEIESIYQALTFELESASNLIEKARRRQALDQSPETEISEVIKKLGAFHLYFTLRKGELNSSECDVTVRLCKKLPFQLIRSAPISKDETGKWGELRQIRIQAITSMASALPLRSQTRINFEKHTGQAEFDHFEVRKSCHEELTEIRNIFRRSVCENFVAALNEKEWGEFSRPIGNYGQGAVRILEPDWWMPEVGDRFDFSTLSSLSNSATTAQAKQNIFNIIEELFLKPLQPNKYPQTHDYLIFLPPMILAENKKYQSYLQFFWKLALSYNNSETEQQRLISLREEIVDSLQENSKLKNELQDNLQSRDGKKIMTAEDVEIVFPLPAASPAKLPNSEINDQSNDNLPAV